MPNNDYQSLQRYLKLKGWVEENFLKTSSIIDAKQIKGGYVSVNTEEEKNNLPAAILIDGSLCYVVESKTTYRYDTSAWVEDAQIKIDTTENWEDIETTYLPGAGVLIIYSDTTTVDEETTIHQKLKIGDGTTFLVDLPFFGTEFEQELQEHINNNIVHITSAERTKWNNKLSDAVENEETLCFIRD